MEVLVRNTAKLKNIDINPKHKTELNEFLTESETLKLPENQEFEVD